MDAIWLHDALRLAVIIGFNLITLIILLKAFKSIDLKEMLREKCPPTPAPAAPAAVPPAAPADPTSSDTSYSRVSGLIGSVVLATFFWGLANVLLLRAFGDATDIAAIQTILANLGSYFLYGSALFAPYAFNQLRAMVK